MPNRLLAAILCLFSVAASAQVAVSVKPRTAPLTFTQKQQFTATVTNTSNTSVRWYVDGVLNGNSTVGTISSSGSYTPPKAMGTHSVKAVSVADSTKSATAKVIMTNLSGVYTWHNNTARNGTNTKEVALTPGTVNSSKFGKLFSRSVDGQIYAQPLYVANLSIPNVGTRNVVFVATQHDSVYAFDADGKRSSPYWKRSFINSTAGVTTAPSSSVPETNITPEVGITGTPVVDGSTMFVVAKTLENGVYVHRLHAISITTGAERNGSPTKISAAVSGNGMGSVGGVVRFDDAASRYALQRAALLISGGIVYVSFGLDLDRNGYHGWVMGYDAVSFQQRFAFCVTPDGNASISNDGKGGVWMAGAGPSADTTYRYFASGNGTFNATSGERSYGDSVLKMEATGAIAKYFTPYDQATLQSNDKDMGSTGAVLVPGQVAGHANLLIAAGKNGKLYLLDRDDMGGYNPAGDTQILQSFFPGASGVFSTPAYWNNTVYVAPNNDVLKAFRMSNGLFSTTPVAKGTTTFSFPGPTPSLSANGSSNGIIWVLQRISGGNAVLRAYNASTLAEIYNSNQAGSRDLPGTSIKFAVPTVANGKVFVGTTTKLAVYGFLP